MTIAQVLPLGPESLRVGWKMAGGGGGGSGRAAIEGYFIWIRKGGGSRERFRKVGGSYYLLVHVFINCPC